jgi:hypothetical protein
VNRNVTFLTKFSINIAGALHRRLATNYTLTVININPNCMRAKAGIFILIFLLLLVGTVAAVGNPDTIIVTSDKPWIIANNVDQSIITITVKNTTSGYEGVIQGVPVNLAVNDTIYGTLGPVTVDLNGNASSTFKVKTKSGAAQITATINGIGLSNSTIQHIDHDSPYNVMFTYPRNGSVATEVNFGLGFTDRHGNRIDNLNLNDLHTVNLSVHGPAMDDCGFAQSGYAHTVSEVPDQNGNVSLSVRLTSKIGYNYIVLYQFGSITDKLETIEAMATGIPYSMTVSSSCIAAGGTCTANNFDYYIIDYFLFDQYNNPVRNRAIWVNTSVPNEQKQYTSNSLGQIELHYGPVFIADEITIDATSIDNHSVTNRTIASFVNSTPTNMVLAVTPQTMASREVKPESVAFVRATVIDLYGNPVPNQEVSFDITAINTGGANTSVPNGTPSFDSLSVVHTITATTDADGNAIVLFYPGSFARLTDLGFNYTASGTCSVKAQWGSTIRSVQVSWKNYPFLSVEAVATPQNIRLNETFDVKINVTGDGYAMPGGGVTAILDQDCSASMKNPDNNGHNRLWNSKEAAKVFVDTLGYGSFIGLISYGTENNNQFHLAPQVDPDLVKAKIDSLQQGTKSKNLSPSIMEAMHNITVTQPYRPLDKVRAVIVLNDGNSNIQNQDEMDALVGYATSQNPKIFIFTVLYLDGAPTNTNKQNIRQMGELANLTEGVMYIPTSPEELKNVYIGIAMNLSKLAGVNATMQINYQTFEVDSQPMPGDIVFDYVPVGPFSTLQSTIDPNGRTSILWPNSSQSVIDQTAEWEANQQLHFDIGTLNVSDQWQTTYRLKANQTGLIKLFDNRSSVSFNDGQDILKFPDLFITVTPNATPFQAQGILDVSHLAVTKSSVVDYAPIEWHTSYEGNSTAMETLAYSDNNQDWVTVETLTNIAPVVDYYHVRHLDVKKLPPGSYWIRVHAVAPDALDDEEITGPFQVGPEGFFIKLT